jgi:hypothetical protein
MSKKPLLFVLAACLCSVNLPAQAAWGDDSYDPSPTKFDLDKDAQFDLVGIITSLIISGRRLSAGKQNFESGFSSGQVLNDWIPIGPVQARFGFGSSPDQVHWQSVIGQIDPSKDQFGVDHPHGTYGNAPGVADDPRNYVVDHKFLSAGLGAPTPDYFVIEFKAPVSFVGFTLINTTAQTEVIAGLTLWRGDSLASAVQIDNIAGSKAIPAGESAGDFSFAIGIGKAGVDAPYLLPTFNFAVLHVNAPDTALGFDNFVAAVPVPEPDSYAMLLAGLGLFGWLRRRRNSATTS